MKKKIILASGSPRRKDLLSILGIPFSVVVSDYEEDHTLKMNPKDMVSFLALLKARDVATKQKDAVIIAADTLVVHKGEIFPKPKNDDEAYEMLQKLSASRHTVVTGIVVFDSESERYKSAVVEAVIELKKLSEEEIHSYIATGEHRDKAGAYSAHEKASIFVKKIEGEPTGVMGLPMYELVELLEEFGIFVSAYWRKK